MSYLRRGTDRYSQGGCVDRRSRVEEGFFPDGCVGRYSRMVRDSVIVVKGSDDFGLTTEMDNFVSSFIETGDPDTTRTIETTRD